MKTGTLFGDFDLTSALNGMRETIYEPAAEQPAEMSSLADIGVSTGPPSGSATYSQSSVEGQLQLNTAQLEAAVQANPAGVQEMLQHWATSFERPSTSWRPRRRAGNADRRRHLQVSELASRIKR